MHNGDEYVPGIHPHLHGSPGYTPTTARLTAEGKKRAADDLFKLAIAIVEEVILQMIDTNEYPGDLPARESLALAANRLRQAKRPENPPDLNFVRDDSIVPHGFYQNDVWVNGWRHFFFATQHVGYAYQSIMVCSVVKSNMQAIVE